MTSETPKAPPPVSVIPPWHSQVLVVFFFALFVYQFPSWDAMDQEDAQLVTFTHRVFPDYVTLHTLAYVRLAFATVVWMVTLEAVLSRGWVQQTPYVSGSRLRTTPIHLVGIKTTFPFTSVSWNILGIAFSCSGYIAWMAAQAQSEGREPPALPPWLLRLALASWEVAAPNTLLVAAVVRYAIWPGALAKGNSTESLRSYRMMFMHNINALMALVETALLGGLPVRFRDLSLAPLVGMAYVLFTWSSTRIWADDVHGPQFIYFFLDCTVPGIFPTAAILVLLLVLLLFYTLFSNSHWILELCQGQFGILGNVAFVTLICGAVMRFRD